MRMRIGAVIAGVVLLCSVGNGQTPFALDPTFQTQISLQYVASALPLEDGKVLIAGQFNYIGQPGVFGLARLNTDGTFDQTFNASNLGSGKLTPWEDVFYVGTMQTVRRIQMDGLQDMSFIEMNLGPYFSSLQGGDYHVFPDGRVVMSGVHLLEDSIRGFMGYHNFIWFTNTGYLDTTRIHRWGDGAIFRFKELPDGKFICSGTNTTFEGQPVDRIFRLHPDGSLDDSFDTGVFSGMGFCYLPLNNGKVVVGGNYRTDQLVNDTIWVAQFLEDGSIDPTFNRPHFSMGALPDPSGNGPAIHSIVAFQDGMFFVMGQFQYVNGQPRRGICILDTNGDLMWPFHDQGVDPFTYMGWTYAAVNGIFPSQDSTFYYIWGAYHGYDDPTGSYPQQRFVTRLHAGDLVTAASPAGPISSDLITLFPNPAHDHITISSPLLSGKRMFVEFRDVPGRLVKSVLSSIDEKISTTDLTNGTYLISLRSEYSSSTCHSRLIIDR